ncbi:DUF1275 domain-containing protein, partial [Burkholderia diffusa]
PDVALWGAVLLLAGAFAEIVRRAWRRAGTGGGDGRDGDGVARTA